MRNVISLTANPERSFKNFEAVIKTHKWPCSCIDVSRALTFNFRTIGTRQEGDKRQQSLALLIIGVVIEIQGQAANRTRETARHVCNLPYGTVW